MHHLLGRRVHVGLSKPARINLARDDEEIGSVRIVALDGVLRSIDDTWAAFDVEGVVFHPQDEPDFVKHGHQRGQAELQVFTDLVHRADDISSAATLDKSLSGRVIPDAAGFAIDVGFGVIPLHEGFQCRALVGSFWYDATVVRVDGIAPDGWALQIITDDVNLVQHLARSMDGSVRGDSKPPYTVRIALAPNAEQRIDVPHGVQRMHQLVRVAGRRW